MIQIYQDKKNTSIPQQINFIGKLEEYDGVAMLFIAEKKLKNYSKLFLGFIKRNRIIWTMKHHKILNLLNETINSKFLTRKWNIFHDPEGSALVMSMYSLLEYSSIYSDTTDSLWFYSKMK